MDRDLSQNEHRLAGLFAAYRDACEIPEAGANFMPGVWSRIDARRGGVQVWRRWAQAFAVAGAAACLVLGALMISPLGQPGLDPQTYVEVLDEDQSPDRMLFQEIALRDGGARTGRQFEMPTTR